MQPNCSRRNSTYTIFPKTRFPSISSITDTYFCPFPPLFQITPTKLLDCVPINVGNIYICVSHGTKHNAWHILSTLYKFFKVNECDSLNQVSLFFRRIEF